jgi:hypothetical protein
MSLTVRLMSLTVSLMSLTLTGDKTGRAGRGTADVPQASHGEDLPRKDRNPPQDRTQDTKEDPSGGGLTNLGGKSVETLTKGSQSGASQGTRGPGTDLKVGSHLEKVDLAHQDLTEPVVTLQEESAADVGQPRGRTLAGIGSRTDAGSGLGGRKRVDTSVRRNILRSRLRAGALPFVCVESQGLDSEPTARTQDRARNKEDSKRNQKEGGGGQDEVTAAGRRLMVTLAHPRITWARGPRAEQEDSPVRRHKRRRVMILDSDSE